MSTFEKIILFTMSTTVLLILVGTVFLIESTEKYRWAKDLTVAPQEVVSDE